jgi:sugar phosphate isomerase/epimerase
LRNAGTLAASALALGPAAQRALALAVDAKDGGTAIEPGLQLYTVREQLATDFRGTLEQVAKIGYREVQVSPRAGHTPAEIRSMLDDNGLVCPSIHLDSRSSTEQEIEAAQTLGARYVFLSAPVQVFRIENGKFLGLRDDVSLDEYRAIADELDQTGATFRDAGLVFGYHNHAFEFPPVDGVVPFDLLLERTDPALVAIELDLGWLQVAGADPLHYIERYPGRFPVCHVKDVLADGSFVDPGAGTVDFKRTFAHASQAGLRHYFVEHDTTADPLATARAGHAYLRTLRAH